MSTEELTRITAEKSEMLNELNMSHLKQEWQPFTPFLEHWTFSLSDRMNARRRLVSRIVAEEERIKAWQDADGKVIDADFMRPDAEAGKNMMEIEGVEALEDLSWIEIVVDART